MSKSRKYDFSVDAETMTLYERKGGQTYPLKWKNDTLWFYLFDHWTAHDGWLRDMFLEAAEKLAEDIILGEDDA